ncbi:DUF4126 domain-containing protein [Desulfobacula toluolica]|uniref:Conserved uncharacterized protein n=1 Tax=Desulfobacula toluolica (strain DSM 7467 / Tol2) TaxID=651182 RepID=K0NNA4_DESTT|nr:DUF4126 domain-containing protein [Desulfobacula toluolica]CCK82090.1 conserved uncharacterized protein [Desulfobacula toluolica Tol2]
MEQLDQIIKTLSLTMGAAWASGINLYATILVLGFLGLTDNIVLPQKLEILMNPMVMSAAGLMYCVEFFADKVPGVDTGWDTLHTFIRIPAGVLLAAGAVGDVNPAVAMAAAIMGGGLAAGSHVTKSGTRLLINTSPEPFSNWTASIVEDVAVIAGVWAALQHPVIFLVLLAVFICLALWLLPKIWSGIKKIFRFLGSIFKKKTLGTISSDDRTAKKSGQV